MVIDTSQMKDIFFNQRNKAKIHKVIHTYGLIVIKVVLEVNLSGALLHLRPSNT